MIKSTTYITVVLLLFILVFSTVAQDFEPEIKINKINGTAYKKVEKSIFNIFELAIWRRINEDTILVYGDQIRTDPNSSIQILIGDNIEIKLEEESQIELIFDKDKYYGKVKLYKGSIWSNIKTGIDELINYEVITPSAVAGVRGTKFLVEYRFERTDLFVEEGEVWLTERTTDKQVKFNEGEIGIVQANQINKYVRDQVKEKISIDQKNLPEEVFDDNKQDEKVDNDQKKPDDNKDIDDNQDQDDDQDVINEDDEDDYEDNESQNESNNEKDLDNNDKSNKNDQE
ncbi:MAG: FecR family protein [Halanaerobiales bacterium]|nr:FecR family protein [Halanaerobiales bacterium]